jgi:hypothetical protein
MNTLILPLLIQVGLTFVILAFLPLKRARDLRADPSIIKPSGLDYRVYSDAAQKVANSFNNQFQLPVLFYVAVLFALLFGAVGFWSGVFAWGFVLSRIVHATIHTTSNSLRPRFLAYAFGMVMLLGLWVVVAARLIDLSAAEGAVGFMQAVPNP